MPNAVQPAPTGRADPRELGNLFGLVFLTLPSASGSAASDWRASSNAWRDQALRRGPRRLRWAVAIGLSPRGSERLSMDFFSAKASLVVSNIPGRRNRFAWPASR